MEATNATPQTIYLKDYQVPAYLLDSADLRFDIHEERTTVFSHLVFHANPKAARRDEPLRLDGEELKLISLSIEGCPLDPSEYRIEGDQLIIPQVPEAFVLDCVVEIQPKANKALSGLYESNGMFCTQCEAEGFRRITYFPDRPDVMTRFTTTIEADAQRFPVLLSNGNLDEAGPTVNGRHVARWVDPFPKPAYLFALVAGDLAHIEDSFTTCSGRKVPLKIYVHKKDLDKCGHAMDSLKRAMKWDEEVYGREYDLDGFMIVSVDHFNMGAMENKGLNIFNSALTLAKPETATDEDYDRIEGVVAHEYFHNWSGDRVTCRDWFQLSLKEGFTVFRDQQFSADMTSHAVKRIEDVTLLRNRQFPEDAGPLAHPVRPESYVEINNFYTMTVYEKGAEVVRMLHTLLGPERFRKGTDLYFSRHDGQAVTTDDFVSALEDAGGMDLTRFKRWYGQAGTPEVTVTDSYDAEKRQWTLVARQSTKPTPGQPVKEPLVIPMAMGLLAKDGSAMPLQLSGEARPTPGATRVLVLQEAEERFTFINVAERPVPSLFRSFSAPIKLHYDYSDDELAFLMAKDGDEFNVWDAGQTLFLRVLLRLIEGGEKALLAPLDSRLVAAVEATLRDTARDPRLVAEAIRTPDEGYLLEQLSAADPQAVERALNFVRRSLALALRDTLTRTYRANSAVAYRNDAASIGKRRLKNACLSYLMALDDEESRALAAKQYALSDNMTDSLAALAALADSESELFDRLLLDFYGKWEAEALVIDKWFLVQSISRRRDTLARVQGLLKHPKFSMTTPNRVRSLVGGFSMRNPFRFHDAGGAGYSFLADQVLALDTFNPQIAARMLNPLSHWRKFEPKRQELMRRELLRVLHTTPLSKDVYEIAAKSLAEAEPK